MKFKIENPVFDCPVFQAKDLLDSWDTSFMFGTVVAKHHVGPHAAGEVVFDWATIDFAKRTVNYQGPRTGFAVDDVEADGGWSLADVAKDCCENTSYTYQLILSAGAQIAQETIELG